MSFRIQDFAFHQHPPPPPLARHTAMAFIAVFPYFLGFLVRFVASPFRGVGGGFKEQQLSDSCYRRL